MHNVPRDEPQVLKLTRSRAPLIRIVVGCPVGRVNGHDESLLPALDGKHESVAEVNEQVLLARTRHVRHLVPTQLPSESFGLIALGAHQGVALWRNKSLATTDATLFS